MNKEAIIEMRKRSGSIKSESSLVCFMYLLMRDHLPPGVVEGLLESSTPKQEFEFTNGWLAEYSKYITERLK